jgi:hypothetical protein
MLKSIMEEVVAEAAIKKAEQEQFEDCIEQGAFFDYDTQEGQSDTLGASSGHDPSFVSGWNAVANITCNEPEGFDPDMYLRGVTEAIAELRRRHAKRAEVKAAHEDDIRAMSEAWVRLTAAGIKVESGWSRLDFKQDQGIPRVIGPEIDSGIPF